MKYKNYYDYKVYIDGRVYSNKRNKFLKGDITKFGYLQYTLSINGERKVIKAHQLVMKVFYGDPPKENMIINHIDGDKLNNHYDNLEWTTYGMNNYHARLFGLNNISKSNSDRWKNPEFREKMTKKLSESHKGLQKGKKNPRFRYLIKDQNGKEYSREELSELINLSLSRTDVLIREASKNKSNDYFNKFGIIVIDTKQ